MHAGGRNQQQLGKHIKPPDMNKFVFQNVLKRPFILPVRFLRHQYHRAQHAECERRGNAIGLSDGHCTPQGMRLQPPAARGVIHRQGRLKLPIAFPVSHAKNGCAGKQAHGPHNAPNRNRCAIHLDRLLRNRKRLHRRVSLQRCGRHIRHDRRCFPRQQSIDAQPGRQRKWNQQPQKRRAPKRQEGLFRHAVDRQRTNHRDCQDHRSARDAHMQKAHIPCLIPAFLQSV